jgi:hypothetical protein
LSSSVLKDATNHAAAKRQLRVVKKEVRLAANEALARKEVSKGEGSKVNNNNNNKETGSTKQKVNRRDGDGGGGGDDDDDDNDEMEIDMGEQEEVLELSWADFSTVIAYIRDHLQYDIAATMRSPNIHNAEHSTSFQPCYQKHVGLEMCVKCQCAAEKTNVKAPPARNKPLPPPPSSFVIKPLTSESSHESRRMLRPLIDHSTNTKDAEDIDYEKKVLSRKC